MKVQATGQWRCLESTNQVLADMSCSTFPAGFSLDVISDLSVKKVQPRRDMTRDVTLGSRYRSGSAIIATIDYLMFYNWLEDARCRDADRCNYSSRPSAILWVRLSSLSWISSVKTDSHKINKITISCCLLMVVKFLILELNWNVHRPAWYI
jgi:hypothetical protein